MLQYKKNVTFKIMIKKGRDEVNSVTDVVNIDNLGKRDPLYTMFRMSLLCYLWSELTKIRIKLTIYLKKKTCKSEFKFLHP